MIIETVTVTGADDNTNIDEMIALSQRFPAIEWGILFSAKKAGTPRYPSIEWMTELKNKKKEILEASPKSKFFKLSAHLCGTTMKHFMLEMGGEVCWDNWSDKHGFTVIDFDETFGRVQLNFNQNRERFTEEDIVNMMFRWLSYMSGTIITQHNAANADIWKVFQRAARDYGDSSRHNMLFDASGGRGKSPETWGRPIAGVLTGYAGGLGPNNLIAEMDAISRQVGNGYTWIDMEGSLRDENDVFSLTRVEEVMKIVEDNGQM